MINPNHFSPHFVLARNLVNRLRYTARNGIGRYTHNGVAVLERAANDVHRLLTEGKTATRLPFDLTEAELVLLTEVFVILRCRIPEQAEDAARLMQHTEIYRTQTDSATFIRELLSGAASWPRPDAIPRPSVN